MRPIVITIFGALGFVSNALGCDHEAGKASPLTEAGIPPSDVVDPTSFDGTRAGEERDVAGVRLTWCPPGTFTLGSPPTELERRPGEDQVAVTPLRAAFRLRFEPARRYDHIGFRVIAVRI